jgi:hypothetical protein
MRGRRTAATLTSDASAFACVRNAHDGEGQYGE